VGYTHYWYREEEIDEGLLGKVAADIERILSLDNSGGHAILY
jgi:hypothetical protein